MSVETVVKLDVVVRLRVVVVWLVGVVVGDDHLVGGFWGGFVLLVLLGWGWWDVEVVEVMGGCGTERKID